MLTRKLGRKKAHRNHMLYNLATSIILHEKVQTTEAKAKEVRIVVETSITTAKKRSVAAKRQLAASFTDTAAVDKLMDDLAVRYANRPGGYTRLLRTGARKGDSADMFLITLLPSDKTETGKTVAAEVKDAQ